MLEHYFKLSVINLATYLYIRIKIWSVINKHIQTISTLFNTVCFPKSIQLAINTVGLPKVTCIHMFTTVWRAKSCEAIITR